MRRISNGSLGKNVNFSSGGPICKKSCSSRSGSSAAKSREYVVDIAGGVSGEVRL